MKHLKGWKQLNELHSDTYYSASKKVKDKYDDIYTSNKLKEWGDVQKDKEEGKISPENKNVLHRKRLRNFYNELKLNFPQILSSMSIINWKDSINIFKTRDMGYLEKNSDLLNICTNYLDLLESTELYTIITNSIIDKFNNVSTTFILKYKDLGYDLDYNSNYNETLLMTGVLSENYQVVKCLLNAGANPNIYSKNRFKPLEKAERNWNSNNYYSIRDLQKTIKILKDHGATVS